MRKWNGAIAGMSIGMRSFFLVHLRSYKAHHEDKTVIGSLSRIHEWKFLPTKVGVLRVTLYAAYVEAGLE